MGPTEECLIPPKHRPGWCLNSKQPDCQSMKCSIIQPWCLMSLCMMLQLDQSDVRRERVSSPHWQSPSWTLMLRPGGHVRESSGVLSGLGNSLLRLILPSWGGFLGASSYHLPLLSLGLSLMSPAVVFTEVYTVRRWGHFGSKALTSSLLFSQCS